METEMTAAPDADVQRAADNVRSLARSLAAAVEAAKAPPAVAEPRRDLTATATAALETLRDAATGHPKLVEVAEAGLRAVTELAKALDLEAGP